MKYLRLSINQEFFTENLNARFLGNIKDINIIIGANNTRKSRFLRNIISQEFNVIVNAPDGLNVAFHESKFFFTEIEKKGKHFMDEKLLQFQFYGQDVKDPKYLNIKEYLENKSQIDFFTLKNTITNINETLLHAAVDDNYKTFQTAVRRFNDFIKLLLGIFINIQKNGLPHGQGNYSVTNVEFVRYLPLPFIENGNSDFAIFVEAIEKTSSYLSILSETSFEIFDKSLVYIPVLRTSRMINGIAGDVFKETILKQHFSNVTGKLKVETGLMLYDKIGLARNGTRKQSRDFSAFEKFVGEIFFRSDDMHIVSHQTEKKDERNIKISLPGELEDISIYDLGDGIQAVINLLFPIFTADDGAWIFIDEPENHLHPGYQNLFMQTLATNQFLISKKIRFFINTHSNHILSGALMGPDSAEVLVFSRRDINTSSIQSFNGNEYYTLEKLGILNTSVLISNCSVWVEGVTDRFYLQSFLYALCNSKTEKDFKPIEGLHFSFIEYGGKNLIHYEFDKEYKNATGNAGDEEIKNKIGAYFINANVFLLADSDFNKEKHLYFEAIKRENFKYYKTGAPEIENILPEKVIKMYLIDELKATKEEIQKIFPINNSVKLGKHLQNKLKHGGSFRNIQAESGGTLSPYYKKRLADFVHKKILNKTIIWEDLKESDILRTVVLDLYNFVRSKNSVSNSIS